MPLAANTGPLQLCTGLICLSDAVSALRAGAFFGMLQFQTGLTCLSDAAADSLSAHTLGELQSLTGLTSLSDQSSPQGTLCFIGGFSPPPLIHRPPPAENST